MAWTRANGHIAGLHRLVGHTHIELERLHDTRVDARRQVHRHVWPRRDVELVRHEDLQASARALRYPHRREQHARSSHAQPKGVVQTRARVAEKARATQSGRSKRRFLLLSTSFLYYILFNT